MAGPSRPDTPERSFRPPPPRPPSRSPHALAAYHRPLRYRHARQPLRPQRPARACISLRLWDDLGGIGALETGRATVRRAFDLASDRGVPPGLAEESFGRILGPTAARRPPAPARGAGRGRGDGGARPILCRQDERAAPGVAARATLTSHQPMLPPAADRGPMIGAHAWHRRREPLDRASGAPGRACPATTPAAGHQGTDATWRDDLRDPIGRDDQGASNALVDAPPEGEPTLRTLPAGRRHGRADLRAGAAAARPSGRRGIRLAAPLQREPLANGRRG